MFSVEAARARKWRQREGTRRNRAQEATNAVYPAPHRFSGPARMAKRARPQDGVVTRVQQQPTIEIPQRRHRGGDAGGVVENCSPRNTSFAADEEKYPTK